MPGLMQNAVERLREVAFVIPRCKPAVSRPQGFAERMRRRINASGRELKTDCFGNLAVESLLRRDWIIAVQIILPNSGELLTSRAENRTDIWPQLSEQRAKLFSRHAC